MEVFDLEKGRLRWDLTDACKYLKGGSKEDRAELVLVVPSGRTRGTVPVLKKLVTVTRVTEHRHMLPKETVESPTLEIFKSHLDTALRTLIRK